MTSPNIDPPREIRLSTDRSRLTLVWEDGRRDVLSAPHLRANSQSAGARRLRLAGIETQVPHDLVLTEVSLLGGYALSLVFSDGHDRGIYPWALLKDLAGPAIGAGKAIP